MRILTRSRFTLSMICFCALCLFALAACSVTVEKNQHVHFNDAVTFPDSLTFSGAENGSATANAAGAESASTQRGLFNFVGDWTSDTAADVEQAIRAGLTANVPLQGGSVSNTTNDTGSTATGASPPSNE